MMNDGPVLKCAMRKPESAGPTSLPALKLAEFRLTALATSEWPTISEVKAWRIGASIAVDMPRTAAPTNTCQSSITFAITKIPITKLASPATALVQIKSFLLFTRSAILPPCRLKRSTGANCTAVTRPSAAPLLSVSSKTSQSWATRCAQVPIFDSAFAG